VRSYDDPCGVARALDVVGERWALLVVRDLLLGPKRFTDLAAGLPGLSQNVLSQRLRDLEAAGVVARRTLGPPSGARVYELTPAGAELREVVTALARWGSREPRVIGGALGVDALALALTTTFDAAAAGGRRAVLALHVGADRLTARVADGRVEVVRGDPADLDHAEPDAVVTADAAALQAVVFGGAPLPEGAVTGDAGTVDWFVRLFPRPVPRPVPRTA
jgi:DNA-binding HxlR family transcriptional regulator